MSWHWFVTRDACVPGLRSPPYQQEFAPNLAADVARVTSVSESVCVPLRCFGHVVEMHETSVLDPGVVAAKHYAPGVGLVKENVLQGDPYDYGLVSVTPGPGASPQEGTP